MNGRLFFHHNMAFKFTTDIQQTLPKRDFKKIETYDIDNILAGKINECFLRNPGIFYTLLDECHSAM